MKTDLQQKTGYPSMDRNHEDCFGPDFLEMTMPQTTIYDYLYQSNKNRLDLPAINYFDNKITYRNFLENSNMVARALSHYGVKKGDIVTVVAPSLPETYYILLGASRLGAVANFVDPRYGEKAIEHKIKDAGSKVVIAFDGAVKTFNRRTKEYKKQHVLDKIGNILKDTKVETVISLPASNSISLMSIIKNDTIRAAMFDRQKSEFKDAYSWKEFFKSGSLSRDLVFPEHEADIPVAIVSTGGSTGTPKSALFSNENIISATMQCRLTGIFPEEARWYDIMPPSIAYGLADGSILPFSLGNEVRLNPDPTAMSLKNPKQLQMVEDLVRFDPHTLACAPNHVLAILDSKEWLNNPHSMINFIVGGDSLNKEQIRRCNEILSTLKRPSNFDKESLLGDRKDVLTINTGWGATETTAAASVARGSENVKEGTVGQTLPYEVVSTFKKNEETGEYIELPYISKDQIDNVTEDQIAELCVSGPNIMLGYLNNPEETAKAIVEHQDGTKWAHSGDLGFVDEDGYVHFIDREKYISVRHDGFKVTPVEIEDVILKDNRIDACKAVIFADPEEDRGTVIKVYYTLRDASSDIKDVEETANLMCEMELADYKCPVDYECMEKLPITPSGKIDVMALKADAEAKATKNVKTKSLTR